MFPKLNIKAKLLFFVRERAKRNRPDFDIFFHCVWIHILQRNEKKKSETRKEMAFCYSCRLVAIVFGLRATTAQKENVDFVLSNRKIFSGNIAENGSQPDTELSPLRS